VVAGCAIALGVTVAYGGDVPPPAVNEPGMRAYADPRTGALLREPPAGATAPAAAAFSRSSAGSIPMPAPGGGVEIDLRADTKPARRDRRGRRHECTCTTARAGG
jgi:hypothetical protein